MDVFLNQSTLRDVFLNQSKLRDVFLNQSTPRGLISLCMWVWFVCISVCVGPFVLFFWGCYTICDKLKRVCEKTSFESKLHYYVFKYFLVYSNSITYTSTNVWVVQIVLNRPYCSEVSTRYESWVVSSHEIMTEWVFTLVCILVGNKWRSYA